ncbi:MAG TPA: HD domain-containing phosphohydrolase [Longimicrobiales bacterium]|nr:HD domain-containing phosphohydrolase [Longimicrobiales bacterium]
MTRIPDPRVARRDARILIVDDEAANVEFLRHVLEPEGYASLFEMTDAQEALDAFPALRPDLIILDLMMPGCDGFEFMERVLEMIDEDEVLPILVATADSSAETRRRALSVGARDFLTKPLSPADVRLRVRNLLDTRLLHEELRRHNERLEEHVGERTRELELARIEILARLARAAEYRDDDTGQHTQRVGRVSARLGEVLGCAADWIELIRRSAPLHDIGKIGIPDAILLKEGPLSSEERQMMQAHANIGADILGGSQVPLLRLAEEIALSHHERWDGLGYPVGIVGSAIPDSGRIVAVADVFDSLTHQRPYKRAWTVREALDELQACAGTQFDPDVVEAMLRIAPEVTVLTGAELPPQPVASTASAGSRPGTGIGRSRRAGVTIGLPAYEGANGDSLAARVGQLEAERVRLARELENTKRKLARRDARIAKLTAARTDR